MTRRVFLSAALMLESTAERGKQAIAATVDALGGRSFLTMRNRVETGRAVTLYRDQLTGLSQSRICTEYPPVNGSNKLGIRERQYFGKKGESSVLLLDGKGYEISFRGVKPLAQDQIDHYFLNTRHNIFYILRQRLNEPGLTVELSGHEVVENQSTDVLDIYDAANERVTVWVNSYSHLPVRQRWYRKEEETGYRYEEVSHFAKYRDTDAGIQWPMDTQRDRDGSRISEIYDEKVAFNVALRDDVFALPRGAKVE